MKHHGKWATALLLFLLPLLPGAAASAETPLSFRSGVTWNSTVADMMAAEGVREYDGNFHSNVIGDRFTRYYIQDRPNGAAVAFYVYQGDEPVMMYTRLPADTMAVPVYDLKAEECTPFFGPPIPFTVLDLHKLLDVLWPGRIAPETLSRLTAWRLEDGTLASLFAIGGDTILAYLNDARITADAD